MKTFTRDLSIVASQWWYEAHKERFKKELGVAYKDLIGVSDGSSIAFFYLEKDLSAIKLAFLNKVETDSQYYSKVRGPFLKSVRETKKYLPQIYDAELSDKVVTKLKKYFLSFYPVYRYTLLAPSTWADDLKKLNRQPVIKQTMEDRYKAEGIYEAVDAALIMLIKAKLKQIGKAEKLAKFLTEEEVSLLAVGNTINWKEVEKRSKGFVYCGNVIHVAQDYLVVFKQNNYAYVEDAAVGNSVKGAVAFDGGVVRGKVQHLVAVDDVSNFKPGNILVSAMTLPDFLPAMKLASAIVTDEGGITSHAAIVSRELKIPCVIATKIATKLFKDGEIVEVNTKTGIVTKLNK